jgi:hypothetical protein
MQWQPIENALNDPRVLAGDPVWLGYSTGPRPTDWNMERCVHTRGGDNYCEPGWYRSPHGGLGSPIWFKPTHWLLPDSPATGFPGNQTSMGAG